MIGGYREWKEDGLYDVVEKGEKRVCDLDLNDRSDWCECHYRRCESG